MAAQSISKVADDTRLGTAPFFPLSLSFLLSLSLSPFSRFFLVLVLALVLLLLLSSCKRSS